MTIIDIWIGILAFSIFLYVVLDGFDLGVGILFPMTKNAAQRDEMIASIAPVWDGNETWLIFTGVCLFGVFPKAYAILLSALYLPVIAMLIGLVFRGVAFEFRQADGHWKTFWDAGFHIGSVVVGFMQGVILGSLIQGLPIADGHYAGTAFGWITPFSLMTGLGVVTGYALMGAAWLWIKTHNEIHDMAETAVKVSLTLTFFSLGIISLWTPFLNPDYLHKWFDSSTISNHLMLGIPVLSVLSALLILYGLNKSRTALPFFGSILLFASGYIGVLYNLYPHIIPPNLTFADAASPESSLTFLLPGTLVLLPLVLGYFIYSHWVFRGKVTTLHD
ncbi:cytochrome d ubiquinol oxidase subunit II [Hydrogenovibrio sp. JE_KL2]|uniref:cytochrome d ubiquinol oxidase subunit II n=1 Tax=Hydrogenovibrio sp. JE_KL2 TaxID=2651188 RepID=UPI00128E4CE6|nr:cytochrome d ubiquinol oxidase subunit II [Hydrogenovibrio sp. JE_KL2]MPQ77132.1 cytochrome d ubiquinol oxidase subunit II [Hydrogenovibrio sp. JE_KL2]